MAGPASKRRLTNARRITRSEINERPQSGRSHVRLISQRYGPMRQMPIPSVPSRSALDGTEHSASREGIADANRRRKVELIKSRCDICVVRCINNRKLCGIKLPP
jgi:hypothetical protein